MNNIEILLVIIIVILVMFAILGRCR